VHAEPADEALTAALNHGVSLGGKTVFEKVGTSGWQVIAFLASLIAGSTTDATCYVEQEALLEGGHSGVLLDWLTTLPGVEKCNYLSKGDLIRRCANTATTD
jgi:hypothetical protein